jgi:hypothetical protein
MTLVEPTQDDFKVARKVLVKHVLPDWAKHVDKKWVQRWNKTIGQAVGLQAKKR